MGFMSRWIERKAIAVVSNAISLNDPSMLRMLMGSRESVGGERVNDFSAMQLSTVWACVRLISQTVATLPLSLYLVDPNGTKSIDLENPLNDILRWQPNADTSSFQFIECLTASSVLTGNGFAKIDRNVVGTVIALTPLNANKTTWRVLSNGVTEFTTYDFVGNKFILSDDEVFHLPGFTLNGRFGLSTIAYATNAMGGAMATERASAKIFENGMRPSGYISADRVLDRAQRERANALIDDFTGSQNLGRTPLLEDGWKYNALTIPPEDAQMLATRAFQVEDLCRFFSVAPSLIGHSTRSATTGTAQEQQMLDFLMKAIQPILSRWEHAVRRCLLLPSQRRGREAGFDTMALLRTDAAGRAALYGALAQNAIATTNEMRRWEGLAFSTEDNADKLRIQANMTLLEKVGATPPPTPPSPLMGHNGGPPLDLSNSPKDTLGRDAPAQGAQRQ